jgi:hypothetical protein
VGAFLYLKVYLIFVAKWSFLSVFVAWNERGVKPLGNYYKRKSPVVV